MAAESALQRRVKLLLQMKGAHVEVRSPSFFTASGVADIIACFRGRYVAIELKAPKKKLRDDQLRFLERVKNAGGEVLQSDSYPDVAKWVNELERRIGSD